MTSTGLWTEILISGFLYLSVAFFAVLKLLNVTDLRFLSNFKDYLAIISGGVVVLSYLVGMMAHRLESIVSDISRPLVRVIQLRIFRRTIVQSIERSQNHRMEHVRVFQYGSERLNRELDFNFSFFVLFRSLVVSSFLLGVSCSFWLMDTSFRKYSLPVFVVSCLIALCFFGAYKKQKDHYMKLRDESFKEMEKIRKES
jgi:hypothetical protein